MFPRFGWLQSEKAAKNSVQSVNFARMRGAGEVKSGGTQGFDRKPMRSYDERGGVWAEYYL
jgi:hypothetical protein